MGGNGHSLWQPSNLCVCVCARARVRVCACVRACACVRVHAFVCARGACVRARALICTRAGRHLAAAGPGSGAPGGKGAQPLALRGHEKMRTREAIGNLQPIFPYSLNGPAPGGKGAQPLALRGRGRGATRPHRPCEQSRDS